jgi:hypothetical protein
MGWTTGVRFPTGAWIFLFATAFRPALRHTQPPIQWGVKVPTHLHLVPRLRMLEDIPPLPQYVFMAWYLFKHGENFTFTYES